MDVRRIRRLFPISRRVVFLEHAGVAPTCIPVANAMRAFLDEWLLHGSDKTDKWYAQVKESKRLFARLIGADEGEVACVANTSTGIGLIGLMLSPGTGSNIVIDDLQFTSDAATWLLRKKYGVEVRYARSVHGQVNLEDLRRLIDDRTVAVNVSHVSWNNGFKFDLQELAEIVHSKGAYLIVDAAQSAGAVRIDVKRDKVDFLVSSCFKWLLSPAGTGFMYVRSDLIEKFDPPIVGWASVTNPDQYDIRTLKLHTTATKYEAGSPSLIGYIGVRAALKLFRSIGMSQIQGRVLRLSEYAINGLRDLGFEVLTPLEPKHRAGIVKFAIKNERKVAERLRRKSIIVGPRPGGIRISPHFYNTEEELDKFLHEMKTLLKQGKN